MADDDTKTLTVSAGPRVIPIIVVPGVMGTRLTDPADNRLAWNPTGSPTGNAPDVFAANKAKLVNVGRALIPDETHEYNATSEVTKKVQVLKIPHFYNIIPDFYGDIAIAMAEELPAKIKAKGATSRVFCCGYDWRQDNAVSAARLSRVVDEARKDTDEKVIILAHSMGGLVSRYYYNQLGGKDKVRALFLLASPSFGAPGSFGGLRSGLPFFDLIRRLINLSNPESLDFMRNMASIHQLLPTDIYCRLLDKQWATFNGGQTGWNPTAPMAQVGPMKFTDTSNFALFYLDIYTGLRDVVSRRALASTMLTTAFDFHQKLLVPGDQDHVALPPITYAVFCNDMKTEAKFDVRFNGITQSGTDVVVDSVTSGNGNTMGDETVPILSSMTSAGLPPPRPRAISKVTHQKMAGDRKIIDFVLDEIPKII